MTPRTVLLVDDDPLVGTVVSRILQLADYDVCQVDTVLDAIAALERGTAPVDLMICDVVLHNESCAPLVEWVGLRFPSTKVLLISGYPLDILLDQRLLSSGIPTQKNVFFRQKPFSRNELLEELDKLLVAAPSAPKGAQTCAAY